MSLFLDGEAEGFTPEEFEDIKMCLETLLSIRAGSQPLDRERGIDYEQTVGFPLDVAKNMLSLEIIEKVERYEPRVEVSSVTFTGDTDGQLVPHIYFVKAGG